MARHRLQITFAGPALGAVLVVAAAGVPAGEGPPAISTAAVSSQQQTHTQAPAIPAIPQDELKLLDWLRAGHYKSWQAASARVQSQGPHFGNVRTYFNDALATSHGANAPDHPAGAAAVKELYGPDGDTVRGWAVSIKLEADSADGANWFWYETYSNVVYANSAGAPLCVGCHRGGRDFVLVPLQLQ